MTVENVREKSMNNKHFFWLFMAWGTVVGRFDHTCVRARSVFFSTAIIHFLAIHCSTHPVEFMAVSYIRIHLRPNPLFSYFSSSLSPSCQNGASPSSFTCNSEWEPHHAAYHPETEERYVKFVSCKDDRGGPFSDILLSASQLAHLIFSLCQVSPSLKQPNFWFSFMQSTLLSMLRCPIFVPASPTWPWWVGSKM